MGAYSHLSVTSRQLAISSYQAPVATALEYDRARRDLAPQFSASGLGVPVKGVIYNYAD